MSSPSETAAASAGETVVAVVEGAIGAAEAAVVAANERAEAAEEVAALVAEGAIQRSITDDVDELREEVEACQRELESARGEIRTLAETVATTQQALTTLVTVEALTLALAEVKALSSPVPNPSNPTQQSGTDQPNNSPQNPAASGDGLPAAEAARSQKPARYRLT